MLFLFLPSGFNIISSGGVLTIFSEGLRALQPYVVGSHLVTDKKMQALRNVLTCSVWARLPKTSSAQRFLPSTMQSPVISYLFFFFPPVYCTSFDKSLKIDSTTLASGLIFEQPIIFSFPCGELAIYSCALFPLS